MDEPDIEDLIIQLKISRRVIVATIHDPDGVLSMDKSQATQLRDWLDRAIAEMEEPQS